MSSVLERRVARVSRFSRFSRLSIAGPRRSLWALAIGALAGLALAGYSLFTAAGTGAHGVPPNAVALVNQRLVLRSDFHNQVEALSGQSFDATSAPQRQQVLDSMITEELLVQRGLEIGLPNTDSDVREALVGAVNLQIGLPLRAQQPGDEALRRYFEAHRDAFMSVGRLRVRDLVLPIGPGEAAATALARAHDAARELRAGADVQAVSRRFGLHETGHVDAEEQLDLTAKAQLGDALFAVAAKLGSGDVSEPVEQPGAVHLLVVVHRVAPQVPAFDAARPQVLAAYQRDAQERLQREYVAFLRGRSEVLIAGADR